MLSTFCPMDIYTFCAGFVFFGLFLDLVLEAKGGVCMYRMGGVGWYVRGGIGVVCVGWVEWDGK